MIKYEATKFRDKTYIEKLDVLRKRLDELQEQNDFISYSKYGDTIIEEAKQLIQQNNEDYEKCYLKNKVSYDELKDKFNEYKNIYGEDNLKQFEKRFNTMKKLIGIHDYSENAKTKKILEELDKNIEESVKKIVEQHENNYEKQLGEFNSLKRKLKGFKWWVKIRKSYKKQINQIENQIEKTEKIFEQNKTNYKEKLTIDLSDFEQFINKNGVILNLRRLIFFCTLQRKEGK